MYIYLSKILKYNLTLITYTPQISEAEGIEYGIIGPTTCMGDHKVRKANSVYSTKTLERIKHRQYKKRKITQIAKTKASECVIVFFFFFFYLFTKRFNTPTNTITIYI